MLINNSTLKDLDIEYKSSIVFGILALVLSILTGLIAGNNIGNIIFKSIILTIVFIIIGYAIIYVIKRFVPEVYAVLANSLMHSIEPANLNAESTIQSTDADKSRPQSEFITDTGSELKEETRDAFRPYDKSDFKEYNISQGKMGKHIVVNERKIQYEPKIMAEAIKTMMRRDNE